MRYEYLHERESVMLCSSDSRSVKDLKRIFRHLGFQLHDDVVSFDRKENYPPWQHSSIAEVEVRNASEVVYGFQDGEWNSIQLDYLFATLPFECADSYIELCMELNARLQTTL